MLTKSPTAYQYKATQLTQAAVVSGMLARFLPIIEKPLRQSKTQIHNVRNELLPSEESPPRILPAPGHSV